MSLKNMSRGILSKAQTQKEEINKQLEEEMSNLELDFENEIKNFKKVLSSKFDLEFKSNSSKILGKYLSESKRVILNSQTIVLSKVYNLCYDNLLNLNKEAREKLLLHLIKKADKILKYDKIICSKKNQSFIKLNSKNCKISVDDIEGLIFESNSGKERLDLTYRVILDEAFESNEDELQKLLFN